MHNFLLHADIQKLLLWKSDIFKQKLAKTSTFLKDSVNDLDSKIS